MHNVLSHYSRWMDGSFLDLDAESIEGEVDEYWRELYKIQKVFTNKQKKIMVGHYFYSGSRYERFYFEIHISYIFYMPVIETCILFS